MHPRTLAGGRSARIAGTAARWVLGKIGGGLFVLWAVATAIFFGIRMIPGDPAEAIMGGPGSQASAEALAQARADYGLDEPLYVQYFGQLWRLATGDLGTSYSLKLPVAEVLGELVPPTLVLAVLALAVAWALALVVAVLSTRSGRLGTALASGLEIVSAAVPHFWLASVLIMLFATALGWLPPVSTNSPAGLVLPVATLALPLAGFLGQVMRDTLDAAHRSPFALSARARGESETGVLLRHSLRHAALPGIALSGWAFGSLLSGAVVVESIFARPGLGRSLLSAVTARDIPMVTGVALLSAAAYVVIMAFSDLAERLADPRMGGS
ncbi:ABC transporter permease [Paeniglutamicibacter sp. ABSL32-1]|uniref:ABC transporter permease n=1 Tax=Paeniglutamicibacter quisquiliarum TaxID=2849498 RepID=UPI001C2D3253|nr:ABC transporter permease [Paeniglutamicibacter quisquiliarum]MBV1777925.1 ABC transporter permease [Paeniglutamicibacter quisquiliarum]